MHHTVTAACLGHLIQLIQTLLKLTKQLCSHGLIRTKTHCFTLWFIQPRPEALSNISWWFTVSLRHSWFTDQGCDSIYFILGLKCAKTVLLFFIDFLQIAM